MCSLALYLKQPWYYPWPMAGKDVSIRISLVEEDRSSERALTALQADLETAPQLKVKRITISNEEQPSGAKGLLQETSLLITATVPALSVLAAILRTWIKSQERHSIKLKIGRDSINLSGPWSDSQRQALDEFLARHPSDHAATTNAATDNFENKSTAGS